MNVCRAKLILGHFSYTRRNAFNKSLFRTRLELMHTESESFTLN